jgi:hypothetical protein
MAGSISQPVSVLTFFSTSQHITTMTLNDVVVDLFIAACWACIDVKTYINPRFRFVLDSPYTVAALFALAGVTFCPGLLDIVQSVSAPPVSWVESLSPVIPKNVWGVYVLVLKKPGYDPLLYVGSCTATYRGVRARLGEHRDGRLSPTNVKKARDFGYDITHMALLAYCDIPSPASIPEIRTLFAALEAVFTAVFWAMVPSENAFGFSHMCPWDRDAFEWLGLGSHNPLHEAIRCHDGEMDFTSQQLEDMARITKEKNAEYQVEYARALRANPTEEYRLRQDLNNRKQKPATQARQQAAVENQTYHCEVCNILCRDAASLRLHNDTPRHKKKLEHGDNDYECVDCGLSFRYLSNFNRHKLSKGHISKTSN